MWWTLAWWEHRQIHAASYPSSPIPPNHTINQPLLSLIINSAFLDASMIDTFIPVPTLSLHPMKSLGLLVNGSVPFGSRSPRILQRKLQTRQQLRFTTMTPSYTPKAASVHSSTYATSLQDQPADPNAPSAKAIDVEENIERVIYGCRFMTFLGVAGSLLGSVLCFLKINYTMQILDLRINQRTEVLVQGSVYVVTSFREYFGTGGKVVMTLIEAIDVYLIGTVMLVFGMGLYELFISNLDIAKTSSDRSSLIGLFKLVERPEWLDIQSLNELKTKLGNVIVTVLLVGLLDKCKKVSITSATDLLCFATSILLCSACLYLLSKLHTSKSSKHVA